MIAPGPETKRPASIMSANSCTCGPKRVRFAEGDLEAVILGRVVAARHHDAAFHVQGEQGKIKEGRGDHAKVGHRQAPLRHALHDEGPEPVGAEPAVPSDRRLCLAPLPHIRGKGPPYVPRQLVGQIDPDDPPDVVFPEYVSVHLHPLAGYRSYRTYRRLTQRTESPKSFL